jgi:hypothetical protein
MKGIASVLGSILMGAVAVGVGTGIFLHKANTDRARLAQLAEQAQADVVLAREQSQEAIEEANKKIAAANDEITKVQSTLKLLEEERDLLARAEPILATSAKTTKGWKEVVSIPLHVSLRFPATSEVETNDSESLTLSKGDLADYTSLIPDERWFSITPYDGKLDEELMGNLTSSTSVSYSVHGRLLVGVRGWYAGKSKPYYVLRVRQKGSFTHLLWIREPSSDPTHPQLFDILGTLDFPS